MIIIDANNLILGRLASYVAKLVLEGEEVRIVNCEKAVITGNRNSIRDNFVRKINRGLPHWGPFYPRRPDLIMKRAIRGMLPRKKEKGRKALKRVLCYIGFPDEIKKKVDSGEARLLTWKDLKKLSVEKVEILKFVRLGDIAKLIGWKPI